MSEHADPVLLVDDDLAVRSSLEFALELEEPAVRAYASGGERLADPDLPAEDVSSSTSAARDQRDQAGRQAGGATAPFHGDPHHGRDSQSVLAVASHPDIHDVLEKPLQDDALIDRIHGAVAASADPSAWGSATGAFLAPLHAAPAPAPESGSWA